MKNNVILSIHPEYAQKILSGLKTVELRSSFKAQNIVGGTALIYSTMPDSAIIGYAKITAIRGEMSLDKLWQDYSLDACISHTEFSKYFEKKDKGTAILLKNPVTLKTPITYPVLCQNWNCPPPQSWRYATPHFVEHIKQMVTL